MKEDESFDLLINAEIKSRATVLRIPVKSFLEGQKYKVSFSVTNLSEETFSGGELRVAVRWATQTQNRFDFELPEILPRKTHLTEERESGVMSRGYGLFFARVLAPHPLKEFKLCTGDQDEPIPFDALHTSNIAFTESILTCTLYIKRF